MVVLGGQSELDRPVHAWARADPFEGVDAQRASRRPGRLDENDRKSRILGSKVRDSIFFQGPGYKFPVIRSTNEHEPVFRLGNVCDSMML